MNPLIDFLNPFYTFPEAPAFSEIEIEVQI